MDIPHSGFYTAPISRQRFEAMLEWSMRNQTEFKLTRPRSQSPAITIYTIHAQSEPFAATITLFSNSNDETSILLKIASKSNRQEQEGYEILESILSQVWGLHLTFEAIEQHAPSIPELASQEESNLIDGIVNVIHENSHLIPNPKAPKPKPGDSVDTWLDWRTAQRKRGKRITLEEIATYSGLSINTLKKESATRKPRGQREHK